MKLGPKAAATTTTTGALMSLILGLKTNLSDDERENGAPFRSAKKNITKKSLEVAQYFSSSIASLRISWKNELAKKKVLIILV